MDLTKLESMSSDALRAIRDKTIEVLATRTDNQLRTGSIAWFKDREGNKRYVKITRANPKSMILTWPFGWTWMLAGFRSL